MCFLRQAIRALAPCTTQRIRDIISWSSGLPRQSQLHIGSFAAWLRDYPCHAYGLPSGPKGSAQSHSHRAFVSQTMTSTSWSSKSAMVVWTLWREALSWTNTKLFSKVPLPFTGNSAALLSKHDDSRLFRQWWVRINSVMEHILYNDGWSTFPAVCCT